MRNASFTSFVRLLAIAAICALAASSTARGDDAPPIRCLFLGDNGHHRPAERFPQLEGVLRKRGIDLTYSDKMESLDPRALAGYDALVIYANTTEISPEQEQALLSFVEGGKGLVALHCASYCFLNSPKYIALVGAQFQRHGTGTFRTAVVDANHAVMRGYEPFESWDETYVHTKHNAEGRTVLEFRREGDRDEPWTWVRTQGKGRVFYTAWGHDERTWRNPGFTNLVERGIRWATGRDPADAARAATNFPIPRMTAQRADVKPFEYQDVGKKIPNYTPGKKWGTQGEPLTKMQLPLAPAESLKHLVVPEGFHVELFASEPELGGKPIAMNWDERGRLWVAETYDYPNELRPSGEGRDQIRICEDTDGDARADKFTVFAEKLSIPTSLTFARGGVIVFDATETVLLRDTNGDDVADSRTVLFGKWALGDTHGGPSNMQYGLDNWIWAMQGYNQSKLEVGGATHEFRQGFFRFKPDGTRLEFIRSTDNNTWGLGTSEEGFVFGSTANHNPSVFMPIENRAYERVRGWTPSLVLPTIADSHLYKPITDRVRQVDHFGGYTAAAGHALYTARNYPPEYWNHTAFVCEPTGHLVGTFVLEPEGSGFRSSNPFNLLASDDEWTAPTMAEVGPDGNVWVIDWYNYIVQHNPTPIGFKTGKGGAYQSDLRDKTRGRIYRVVYDGTDDGKQPWPPRFSLAGAAPQQLVETLRHPNLFWRRHAQRLLVERGQRDVVAALVEMARDPACDALGLNVGVIHALWTFEGLGAFEESAPSSEARSVAVAALRHKSSGVRRNAVQVLPRQVTSTEAILDAGLLSDVDPHVRLAALVALAELPPTSNSATALLSVFRDPANTRDRWLPEAAICAAATCSETFLRGLPVVKQPDAKFVAAAATLAEHRARSGPVDLVDPLVERLEETDPSLADAIVQGLAAGWPKDRAAHLSAASEEILDRVAAKLPAERRPRLVQLASRWGSSRFEKYAAEITAALLARVRDESAATKERLDAARQLVAYRSADAETVRTLLELVTPSVPVDLAAGLVRALEMSEAPETAALVLERFPSLTPAVRAAAVTVLVGRPAWTLVLVDAGDKGNVQIADLSLDVQRSLSDHPDAALRRRARQWLGRKGALPNADRQKVLDEFLPVARTSGDAAAGRAVYAKTCAKCHVHGELGQRIGPDLTGVAVHTKEELLTNIVDPSRSVEGNFRVYTLATTDGRVLSGLLASESKTAVELIDVDANRKTILREDIEQLTASTRSLMPEGFEKQLGKQEISDLLEFLSQRGKYLPLPLDKVATATSTRGMFYDHESEAERLVFDDWKPKTFRGVPFQLVDPQQDRVANVILLHGPQGDVSSKMPKSVSLPCHAPAGLIHFLSGVSGWGFPLGETGTVSMIVRLCYEDGQTEDHPLANGVEFADYIRRVDVTGSQFAFDLAGRQIRYLAIAPKRHDTIERIELVKGTDDTAPVVMAVTIESP